MVSPIPTVSFQTALCREIGLRFSDLVSREPATSFSAMPAQELLPRVLNLTSNSPASKWTMKVRPLISRASQGFSVDQIPSSLASVLQPDFRPDHAWLGGVREYIGASLDCTRQRLSWTKQLQKNPEDRDTWQIYGDWLAAQGDPRGELILLDLRLEEGVSLEERATLEERKSALERDLEKGFRVRSRIGEREQLSWKRGYLHALTTFTDKTSRVLRILKSEEALFLKEWRCHQVSSEEFKELANPTYLPCLTSLYICGYKVARILADSPLLQHLKTLSLRHHFIGADEIRALVHSPWRGSLTTLDLKGNWLRDEGVMILAESSCMETLESLNVQDNKFGIVGLQALVDSLPRGSLKNLDLAENGLGDEGAMLLAKSSLGALTSLGLRANRIGPRGFFALANSASLGSLTHLDLGSNGTGDIETIRALIHSSAFGSLKSLNLGGNWIQKRGKELLDAWSRRMRITVTYKDAHSSDLKRS